MSQAASLDFDSTHDASRLPLTRRGFCILVRLIPELT
jgi:hypothetical protein